MRWLREVGIILGLGGVAIASTAKVVEVSPFRNSESDGSGFVAIQAEHSGVIHVNEYTHPKRWTTLWHQYFLGTIGSGIALGDVDGDGLADLFAVGKDSDNRLYLNEGDFRFREVGRARGIHSLGKIGAGVAMLDIDNDGDLDIYVTYTGFPNELYLNNGGGYFEESASLWGLDISTGSNAPSFSDYDRDGDLDLYLQCNFLTASGFAEGMPDFLYENRNGLFVDVTQKAGISGRGQGHAALWWDFNDDNWPDLYVANDFEAADRLYLNNKDGTFSDVIASELVSSPYSAMGADFGDLNNDGYSELFVGEMAAADPEKHQRTVASIETKSIHASRSSVSQYMHNMLSTRIGKSQQVEIARQAGLAATDWTWAVRIADLDNDGLQDVYVNNGMIRAFHDGDLGMKSEKARTGWQRMAYFKQAPLYEEVNLWYRNKGGFRFEEEGKDVGLAKLGVSFSAAFADFDLDGDLDLVLSNLNEAPTLYRNDLALGESLSIGLKGVSSNRFGIGAKLKLFLGGGILCREVSLARGYLSTDEPYVHFGLGRGQKIDRLEIEWPSGSRQTVRSLLSGNRYLIEEKDNGISPIEETETVFVPSDLTVSKEANSVEDVYRLYPMQMLKPEVEFRSGPPIQLVDLDGDDDLDLVMGGATGHETKVFINEKGRRLAYARQEAFEDDFDSEDSSLVAIDLDADGRMELLVGSGGEELDAGDEYYKDRVYSFDSDSLEFKAWRHAPEFPATPTNDLLLIDVDGDGDGDLLQASGSVARKYPFHERNLVWLRADNGFELDDRSPFSEAFGSSGNTSRLLAVDWSGDGKMDLVQAVRWGSPVFWKMGDSGLERQDAVVDVGSLKGAWRSIASGDFDGDGRTDIVLGNWGLNLRRVPTDESPWVLYVPRDPSWDNVYINCFTHEGRLLPLESRILNSAQFPGLLEATTDSIADYARKEVSEIFTNELLERCQRFEINETRSIALLQKEAGRFTPVELPWWAQTGEMVDILALDYDEDGWEDLVLSLEPRAPNLWVDRPLKGHVILLRNNAGRGFEALLPRESGLEINGVPRRFACGDLDGDGRKELLLSLNEGELKVFSLGRSGIVE
ncbi:VCBS repeat-containing protein [Pelagicoccus sp. NFK12]|uniref:VCBS repeat-containing protein n=1 Tax=Pelagicoccus enzymogenes TaxID=2773457 RepID=A0A927IJR9_9BACT|nr:VCBS repeat-containing protein [Pelagicoccus enzymogenes]MBD5782611.1 VCBS repeat-containing protein [Pelagicoccus enzymogenes]